MKPNAIRKAVFPVAGMGTRFLPATKANPKEMLPVVDKPLIQYAVEEAVAAGIRELIFVTSSSKRAIEDHFDSNFELESKLRERGRDDLLAILEGILPAGVTCSYIRQPDALGLGHAVLCAQNLVGNEPFAVLLADDLISNSHGQPCLVQMSEVYAKTNASVLAVQPVAREDISKYGVVAVDNSQLRARPISGILEKPKPELAPSNLGVVGRYILTPDIFTYLQTTAPGAGGEIQLTDAIAAQIANAPVYAYEFIGQRFDCGSKIGYLEATVAMALQHPGVGQSFKQLILETAKTLTHETKVEVDIA